MAGALGGRGVSYDRPVVDMVIESALATMGWVVYRGTPRVRKNSVATWAMLATMLGSQAAVDAAQQIRLTRAPELRRICIRALGR